MSRSKDREYRKWRAQVIRRDKACHICGSKHRRSAHHVNSWRYFPEERYDVDNGVTLCGFHHMLFHNSYKRSYRQKCTRYDWDNFLELLDRLENYRIKNQDAPSP